MVKNHAQGKRERKLTSPSGEQNPRDWRMRPEVQLRAQRYGEFLSQHPLVRAAMDHDEKKLERLFDELGI